MAEKTITLRVELTATEAENLAQYLKRAGVSDYRAKARDDEEAYAMRDAAERVADALSSAGYAPR
jgi:hypothetical protein